MSSFTAIDLSQLPPPNAVEQLSFEAIYDTMKSNLNGLEPLLFDDSSSHPSIQKAERVVDDNGDVYFRVPAVVDQLLYVDLESEPSAKILGVCAYRESLLRQRVNESLRAVMLAYAHGSDLDQHAANYNIKRLMVDPGNPETIPPEPPIYESDTELRRRVLLVFESLSVAGPAGAYIYHALAADPQVQDAAVKSQTPGDVLLTIQSRQGSGTADKALIDAVTIWLADDKRPLTDNLIVQSTSIIDYAVEAELHLQAEPDAATVLQQAHAQTEAYTSEQHRIGRPVTRSGLFAALHTTGVNNVVLTSPPSDVLPDDTETPYCTDIRISKASPSYV